jgi:hypothetical protein
MLLTIASLMFVICAIPQVIRNLRFKDTITQSIISNSLIFFASLISLIAYLNLHLFTASIFLVIEVFITGILIVQIIYWRKHRKNKHVEELVQKTEGVRSFIRSVRGVK